MLMVRDFSIHESEGCLEIRAETYLNGTWRFVDSFESSPEKKRILERLIKKMDHFINQDSWISGYLTVDQPSAKTMLNSGFEIRCDA